MIEKLLRGELSFKDEIGLKKKEAADEGEVMAGAGNLKEFAAAGMRNKSTEFVDAGGKVYLPLA